MTPCQVSVQNSQQANGWSVASPISLQSKVGDSDDAKYGGFEQVEHIKYPVKRFNGQNFIEIYLPARTAIVLKEGRARAIPKKILEAEEMAKKMEEANETK